MESGTEASAAKCITGFDAVFPEHLGQAVRLGDVTHDQTGGRVGDGRDISLHQIVIGDGIMAVTGAASGSQRFPHIPLLRSGESSSTNSSIIQDQVGRVSKIRRGQGSGHAGSPPDDSR